MSSFALSQILIAIAIGCDLLSFQFKARQRILVCLCCSCLLISAHFALLGLWTAMGLAFLAAIRMVASYLTTSKRVMGVFIVAAVLTAVLTYHGLLSVLSCLGAIFGTVGSFCREDRQLRLVMMCATSFWLVHNILAGTPTAVVMEALFLGSNFLGYYRFYLRPSGNADISSPASGEQ